jgi:hypothetical protein
MMNREVCESLLFIISDNTRTRGNVLKRGVRKGSLGEEVK